MGGGDGGGGEGGGGARTRGTVIGVGAWVGVLELNTLTPSVCESKEGGVEARAVTWLSVTAGVAPACAVGITTRVSTMTLPAETRKTMWHWGS